MCKLDLEKAEETQIKLPTSIGSQRKQENSRKNIYFCFIDCAKAFDCVDHNKLWKILQEKGIPEHLTHLLRNLYAGQEAAVRAGLGTMDQFKIGKGVRESCILSPCVFNLYAGYIMQNVPGWMSHSWNQDCQEKINNLRYADTTLTGESEEELKSLWSVKEESEKAGFKTQHSKD